MPCKVALDDRDSKVLAGATSVHTIPCPAQGGGAAALTLIRTMTPMLLFLALNFFSSVQVTGKHLFFFNFISFLSFLIRVQVIRLVRFKTVVTCEISTHLECFALI